MKTDDDVICLPPASSALLYGRGIFSTLTIFAGIPFLWDKHWRRFISAAAVVGLDLGNFSSESVHLALDAALRARSIVNGRARITFCDQRPGHVWQGIATHEGPTLMSVIVGDSRSSTRQLRCCVSLHAINSRSPLAGVKSCNYLENILAIEESRHRGFDEAIRINEKGMVTGGCMSNVFWLKDGRLFTPALSTGCLPGTTREFVLENVECAEVEAEIGELENSDAVFLTSTGLGIAAVNEFNGRTLPFNDHPILRLIEDNALP